MTKDKTEEVDDAVKEPALDAHTPSTDAEGNPVLVATFETPAGVATHVEPAPEEQPDEDAENGKKPGLLDTSSTVNTDDDEHPF